MRVHLPLIALVLALAAAPASIAADAKPTRKQIEKDLALVAELTSPKQVQPAEPVTLRMRIANTSKTLTHKLVRPNDGSESGWREPHVFLTAERDRGDGKWRKVASKTLMRCGMFADDWHADVFDLKPDAKTEFANWLPPAGMLLELEKPGRYRIRAHYRYTSGRIGMRGVAGGPQKVDPGPMKGVPAFELVSKPVEIVVANDLEVTARAVAGIRPKTPTLLSTLIEVRVKNVSDAPVKITPAEWSPSAQFQAPVPKMEAVALKYKTGSVTLGPGRSLVLYGKGPFARGRDVRVTTDADKGVLKLQVVLGKLTGQGARYTSAPVEIPIASGD
jgi:hypothetical protein